ncbi:hypothetical protein [Streptomyces sp. NPDC017941]|uniref:hypothetical protein n=1 Tax=Streptomyces sp. NPDC017941 TaxID=3365018 RepID=UPI00378B4B7D
MPVTVAGAVSCLHGLFRGGEADRRYAAGAEGLPAGRRGEQVLFYDAAVANPASQSFGPLLTPERARTLLATPRGDEATGAVPAGVDEDPKAWHGLACFAEQAPARPGPGEGCATASWSPYAPGTTGTPQRIRPKSPRRPDI